jgi:hypothetical protein
MRDRDQWLAVALFGVIGYAAVTLIRKGAAALNPANPNNVAASAANSVVQSITGDPNATVGTAIYNATHDSSSASATYRPATFPDGTRHAVDLSTVDANGMFTYSDGTIYHLSQDGTGAWNAVPPPPDLTQAALAALGIGP